MLDTVTESIDLAEVTPEQEVRISIDDKHALLFRIDPPSIFDESYVFGIEISRLKLIMGASEGHVGGQFIDLNEVNMDDIIEVVGFIVPPSPHTSVQRNLEIGRSFYITGVGYEYLRQETRGTITSIEVYERF